VQVRDDVEAVVVRIYDGTVRSDVVAENGGSWGRKTAAVVIDDELAEVEKDHERERDVSNATESVILGELPASVILGVRTGNGILYELPGNVILDVLLVSWSDERIHVVHHVLRWRKPVPQQFVPFVVLGWDDQSSCPAALLGAFPPESE